MKWPSANSNDRKSVFYTSEDSAKMLASVKKEGTSVTDNVFSFKMGGDDETTESQNSKSSSSIESNSKTYNNNGTDMKRYLKNFMLFSNLEIESEKKCRDEQLSKIVKALMYFEKKLKKEQEVIQQQLCEKDKVINRQMHTISNMKVKFGVECDELDDDVSLHETAEYCPMCRKKYYLRATKSTATQTVNKTFPTNISDDYSSIQSIEYMSSSEEQEALLSPNPFSTARRSKKYTSKKSYKDYLQSRPHSAENNKSSKGNITIANGNSNSSASGDFPNSSDNNNNNINSNRENLNGKEIGISKSTNGGGASKFSLIMNDIHGIRQQKQQSCDDTHSLKINRMHGISLTSLNGNERKDISTQNNNSDEGDGDEMMRVAAENGNQSAINTMVEIRERQHDSAVITRKYCDDGLEVKQKIATRDDWYISDIEETETLGGKPSYSNCTGVSNSVLECVNQILLQQSMDEFIETQHEKRSSFASSDSKDSHSSAPPTRSNKRVHFSTKNSMVQITPLPRTPPSDHHSDDMLNSTYENQSTYSNEYEPIGSSRTYVDMDTKSLDNYKPTLPPKPNNLMKLQQISKQRQFVQDQIYKPKNSDYDLNESEPDYCSISEIQDNIKSVKIVTAEVHNNADDNEYSEIKEVPTPSPLIGEDSFEDVPKLPNVYSIIPGFEPTTPTRKESTVKCIGHDNYITKSPMKKKIMSISSPSSILTEINNVKKPQPVSPKSAPPVIPTKAQQTIQIIDEKIQQETFDWYNLDAEYQSKTEVITTQIENIDEMYQFDDEGLNSVMNSEESDVKVEYNLDFEFDQALSENGIEIETNNNNFTTVIKINECSSSNESSPTPVMNNKTTSKTSTSLIELAETPKLDLKKKLNYEKFLSESGMLSKPLMGRKKFYAGSFV